MPNYEKQYYAMFNAITTAIKLMDENKGEYALQILKSAQQVAEEHMLGEGNT